MYYSGTIVQYGVMIASEDCKRIFKQCINDYHKFDSVDQPIHNPYSETEIEYLLYLKCWIDSVQWHYEDIIRDPDINPEYGVNLKRLIDHSNQRRTDVVEQIDDWFSKQFHEVEYEENARLNTESPAWVIDRLSILALKMFHMEEQVNRSDASQDHLNRSEQKLSVLKEQQNDLSLSLDQFLDDIKNGRRRMKVYRQMKMYNDPETNPVLYNRDKL